MSTHACDVAIIGAGLSGLATAWQLLEHQQQASIVVLEARDRIGGRTLSQPWADSDAMDLGGSWIGPKQPLVLHLAQRLGLKLVRQPWFDDPPSPEAAAGNVDDATTCHPPPKNSRRPPQATAAAQGQIMTMQAAAAAAETLATTAMARTASAAAAAAAEPGSTSVIPHSLLTSEPSGDLQTPAPHTPAPSPPSSTLPPSSTPTSLLASMGSGFPPPLSTLSTHASLHSTPSLNSGSSSSLLSAVEAAELATLLQRLDRMAGSVLGPPWAQCPEAEAWDSLSALEWLRANAGHEGVLREMILFVQTVMSCEPSELSFLYFLFYIQSSGGIAQLADGEGGAQTWRLRGGAQQLSLGLAEGVEARGGKVVLGAPVRAVVAGGSGWDACARAAHAAATTTPIATAAAATPATDTTTPATTNTRAAVTAVTASTGTAAAAAATPATVITTAMTTTTAAAVTAVTASTTTAATATTATTTPAAATATHPSTPHPIPSDRVGVYLQDGRLLLARHVVLALPPPVWSSTIQFSPPLPEAKRKLGSTMFMGSAAKCILLFSEPFWQRADVRPTGQLEQMGPIANLFPTCIGGQPGLVGIVTADRARQFVQLPADERRERVLGQLAEYFCVGRCELEELLRHYAYHTFIGDEFSGGCFTALMPPGLATSVGDCLRLPVGRLHFAGSETAQRCCGYFEGALEAGQRAAEEVLGALHRSS